MGISKKNCKRSYYLGISIKRNVKFWVFNITSFLEYYFKYLLIVFNIRFSILCNLYYQDINTK